MAAPVVSLYEGLFLVSQNAATDLNAAIEHVKQILTRADHVGEVELEMFKKGQFDWAPKKPEPAKDELVIPGVPELSGEML